MDEQYEFPSFSKTPLKSAREKTAMETTSKKEPLTLNLEREAENSHWERYRALTRREKIFFPGIILFLRSILKYQE